MQIDEMNGLYDALRSRRRADRDAILASARKRIDTVVQAARWRHEIYADGARSFMQTEMERVEDIFGPAILLLLLGESAPSLEKLPDEVTEVLRALGLVPDAAKCWPSP